MPMKRELYPDNWEEIATEVKNAAGWKCQKCDRPCLKPNADWVSFCSNLLHKGSGWYEETFEYDLDGNIIEKKGRFILTTAHLDHDPSNCKRENLKALCPACHLQYDLEEHIKNASGARYRKREQQGQLTIWG
jgi:hypothetical protein